MCSVSDCPLKIRGQALPPGSAGLWYFLFSLLQFFSIVHYPFSINSCGSMRLRMNIWRSAFQAGFWCWFLPQNEFCGYENSAFQAKKNPQRQKSIAVVAFNSPPHLCLKGNNLHNRRSPTCGQWHHYQPPCLKGRTIAAEWRISAPGKNKQNL